MYHWSMNDLIIATSSNYSNTLPVANEKKIELHETNEGIYTSDWKNIIILPITNCYLPSQLRTPQKPYQYLQVTPTGTVAVILVRYA